MQVAVGSTKVNVQEWRSGPPALFLHGFPLTSAMWEPVSKRMSGDARILAPDLRGFGKTPGPFPATLADHARELLLLLDALKLKDPLPLVGFSMGGYIAFEMWRQAPERFSCLGLVDTRAGPDDDTGRQKRLDTAKKVEAEGTESVVTAMRTSLFAPDAPEELRDAWAQIMRKAPPLSVAGALRAMAARADSRPLLPEIKVPTLVIVGEKDALTPPASAEEMENALPDSELVEVQRAGHMAPVERPGAVGEALSRLFARAS